MRKLCLFLGLAGLFFQLKLGAVLLVVMFFLAKNIDTLYSATFAIDPLGALGILNALHASARALVRYGSLAAAVVIAALFTWRGAIGRHSAFSPRVWGVFGACGALLLLPGLDFVQPLSLFKLQHFLTAITRLFLLHWVANIVVVLLFLKMAVDLALTDEDDDGSRITWPEAVAAVLPGRGLFRLFVALAIFVGMSVEFFPPEVLRYLPGGTSGVLLGVLPGAPSQTLLMWTGWAAWLAALLIPLAFIKRLGGIALVDRVTSPRPGWVLINTGLVVIAGVLLLLKGAGYYLNVRMDTGVGYGALVMAYCVAAIVLTWRFRASLAARMLLPMSIPMAVLFWMYVASMGDAALGGSVQPGRGSGKVVLAGTFVALSMLAAPAVALGNGLLGIGLCRLLFNLRPAGETPPAWEQDAAPGFSGDVVPDEHQPVVSSVEENAEEAIARLRQALRKKPDDMQLNWRLHHALTQDDRHTEAMLAHARGLLPLLLRHSRRRDAVEVVKTCVTRDAAFKPRADELVPLVKILLADHEAATALRLMDKFDRLNPGHVAIPTVYYLSAQALSELKRKEPATKLLDALIKRFPDAPIVGEARRLRSALDSSDQS